MEALGSGSALIGRLHNNIFGRSGGQAGQREGRGNAAEVGAKQEERQMLAAASLEESTKLIRSIEEDVMKLFY